MLSHAVEEVVHNARLCGNAHIHFLGNVFVVIVAAARGEGEHGSGHHEDVSPNFLCFHIYYIS